MWWHLAPKGSGHRYYIWVGKDAFDGAVCLRLACSRRMNEVLGFLGECWKDLGRPAQVQFDNACELACWAPAARTLSRLIRLCLRFGVSPVLIPNEEPPFNGGVLTPTACPRSRCSPHRPGTSVANCRDCRRQSIPGTPTRGGGPDTGVTPPRPAAAEAAVRFAVPTGRLPPAAGRVTSIRRVSVAGTVVVLSQSFRVGKEPRGLYLQMVVDTGRAPDPYLNGRVLKCWPTSC